MQFTTHASPSRDPEKSAMGVKFSRTPSVGTQQPEQGLESMAGVDRITGWRGQLISHAALLHISSKYKFNNTSLIGSIHKSYDAPRGVNRITKKELSHLLYMAKMRHKGGRG